MQEMLTDGPLRDRGGDLTMPFCVSRCLARVFVDGAALTEGNDYAPFVPDRSLLSEMLEERALPGLATLKTATIDLTGRVPIKRFHSREANGRRPKRGWRRRLSTKRRERALSTVAKASTS